MPESFNKKSIDNHIYTFIKNSDSKFICKLEPNWITIVNILLIFQVVKITQCSGKCLNKLIILSVLRAFLDILDGGVARKCNKTSKVGKNLDILGDTLFAISILFMFINNISSKYNYLKYLLFFGICVTIKMSINAIKDENYEFIKNNKLFSFVHDNQIIFIPIFTMIPYFYIHPNELPQFIRNII